MNAVPKHPSTSADLILHMKDRGYEIITGNDLDEVLFAVDR
jgi:hypothetical protein